MADAAELAGLPNRVEAVETNLTEFRVEVRQEFATVRSEIKSAIKESENETQRQMFLMHEDLVQRITASQEDLRREMRDLNDDTRRYMRVLHEALLQRIATIGEGR